MGVPQKKFAQVGGASVCYVEGGQGPTLVLIHGFLVSHAVWNDVWDLLSPHFRIIAPDLLGHGDSARPPVGSTPYDADDLADRVAGLLETLGVKNATVVGHSMGGRIATHVTLRHPALVGRLVLMDSVGVPTELPLLGKIAALPGLGYVIFKYIYNRKVVRDYFINDVYKDPARVTPALVDEVYRCLELPNGRDAIYAVFRAVVAPGRQAVDVEGLLKGLRVPVKILWGKFDKIFPVANARRFEQLIPGATLTVIPGIGHSPPDESPARTAEEIRAFALA